MKLITTVKKVAVKIIRQKLTYHQKIRSDDYQKQTPYYLAFLLDETIVFPIIINFSNISHNVRAENPTKSPSVPPNSATSEVQVYTRTSVSTKVSFETANKAK